MTDVSVGLRGKLLVERYGKTCNVFDKYEFLEMIGGRSTGSVYKAKIKESSIGGMAFSNRSFVRRLFGRKKFQNVDRRKNDVFYAIKSFLIPRLSKEQLGKLKNEINILRNLDHPNIVKAHEVCYFEKKRNKGYNRTQIYFVMECCNGGDLYTNMPYTERDAAKISKQIVSAVTYMHNQGIVHGDLRFENVLFANSSRKYEVKLIDFGSSFQYKEDDPKKLSPVANPFYGTAPEVLRGQPYTPKGDMWSVGVIMYMLLSSKKPFFDRNSKIMIDMILDADYVPMVGSHSLPVWSTRSKDAKDLVSSLLVLDSQQRLDARVALGHQWLGLVKGVTGEITLTADDLKEVGNTLSKYRQTSLLKRIALNCIAHKSTVEDIASLRKVFEIYDKMNDGAIDFKEFREAIEEFNLFSDEETLEIYRSISMNQDQSIFFTEFVAATLEARGQIEEERVAEAFDQLDYCCTGFITRDNLRLVLGENVPEKVITGIMDEADADGNGEIDYQEFLDTFREVKKSLTFLSVEEPESTASEDNMMGNGDHNNMSNDATSNGAKGPGYDINSHSTLGESSHSSNGSLGCSNRRRIGKNFKKMTSRIFHHQPRSKDFREEGDLSYRNGDEQEDFFQEDEQGVDPSFSHVTSANVGVANSAMVMF